MWVSLIYAIRSLFFAHFWPSRFIWHFHSAQEIEREFSFPPPARRVERLLIDGGQHMNRLSIGQSYRLHIGRRNREEIERCIYSGIAGISLEFMAQARHMCINSYE